VKFKSCPVTIKAAGEQDGTEDGVFEALVATYDVDSIGDRIVPGAFADTLAEWKASGDPIPVYWSHRMDDPDYNIGFVEDAEERAEGLWVKGRLDLDASKAAQVYRLMKGRRVTQFSFAYDVIDGSPAKSEGADEFELRKLKVYEVGPTPIGMNQATELLGVKHAITEATDALGGLAEKMSGRLAAVKAGRTLSAKNEGRLRDAATLITEVLGSLPSEGDDEKATPAPPANVEELQVAPAVKTDEPARHGTASLRQRLDLELMQLEADAL
jgi:HK97 family phage prohead protease